MDSLLAALPTGVLYILTPFNEMSAHVFLSHNTANKPVVEELARRPRSQPGPATQAVSPGIRQRTALPYLEDYHNFHHGFFVDVGKGSERILKGFSISGIAAPKVLFLVLWLIFKW
jgi:hypothetical protein